MVKTKTTSQDVDLNEVPTRRPRRKKRTRFTIAAVVVGAYVDLVILMVGIGATVELWTAPGSSMLWKLVFPIITISGIIAALRQYRSRPRDPFTGLARAEVALAIAGLCTLAAVAAAPN